MLVLKEGLELLHHSVTQGPRAGVVEAKHEPWGSPGLGGWKWAETCVLWRLRQKVLFVFWRVSSTLPHKSGKELQSVASLSSKGWSETQLVELHVDPGVLVAPDMDELQKTKEIQVFHWVHPMASMHDLYVKKRGSLRPQDSSQITR